MKPTSGSHRAGAYTRDTALRRARISLVHFGPYDFCVRAAAYPPSQQLDAGGLTESAARRGVPDRRQNRGRALEVRPGPQPSRRPAAVYSQCTKFPLGVSFNRCSPSADCIDDRGASSERCRDRPPASRAAQHPRRARPLRGRCRVRRARRQTGLAARMRCAGGRPPASRTHLRPDEHETDVLQGTTTTGRSDRWSTLCAVLPTRTLASSESPREPMTMIEASRCFACSTISRAACP